MELSKRSRLIAYYSFVVIAALAFIAVDFSLLQHNFAQSETPSNISANGYITTSNNQRGQVSATGSNYGTPQGQVYFNDGGSANWVAGNMTSLIFSNCVATVTSTVALSDYSRATAQSVWDANNQTVDYTVTSPTKGLVMSSGGAKTIDGYISIWPGCGSAPQNLPPTVTLTSPSNGATYTTPATVSLSATATDSDGTVSSVQFYQGSTLIGSGSLSGGAYRYSWTNVAAGTYSISAKATDNDGATGTSTPISITVSAPSTPPPSTPAPPPSSPSVPPAPGSPTSPNAPSTAPTYISGTSAGTNQAPAATTSSAITPTGTLTFSLTSNKVTLTWTASSTTDITGYHIYRDNGDGKTFTNIGNANPGIVTYLDTTGSPGKTYSYFVRAYRGTDESASSNTVKVSILGANTAVAKTTTTTAKSTKALLWISAFLLGALLITLIIFRKTILYWLGKARPKTQDAT